jgi:UDP-2,4-diacetamido-2,4,6-trideoxy-beta-L-altropyranose hydrolase
MNLGTLLIRADTSVAMGTGHVMRCLALAQAWQDKGGTVVMAMAEATPAIEERLRRESIAVVRLQALSGSQEDASGTVALARQRNATWTVIDGYRFDEAYQRVFKSEHLRLLLVSDDAQAMTHLADMILNQNGFAAEEFYRDRKPGTRLLLGTRYAMLRREFRNWREWKRKIPATGKKILVTIGGSDPDNFTLKVVEALATADSESIDVVVVAGGSNPHQAGLKRAIATVRYPVRLLSDVENMPELMAWADLAVCGAGSTCWEMCLLGVPMILVTIAENQRAIAQGMMKAGAAKSLGWHEDVDQAAIGISVCQLSGDGIARMKMSQAGRRLVDGDGRERVLAAMLAGEAKCG